MSNARDSTSTRVPTTAFWTEYLGFGHGFKKTVVVGGGNARFFCQADTYIQIITKHNRESHTYNAYIRTYIHTLYYVTLLYLTYIQTYTCMTLHTLPCFTLPCITLHYVHYYYYIALSCIIYIAYNTYST